MPKFLEELQLKPLTSVTTPREGISLFNEGGVLKVLHSNGKEQALLTQLNGSVDLSDFATKAYVEDIVGRIDIGSLDLSAYAKKTELPTKTSQLTNDSGYVLTSTLTTTYAKKTEIPKRVSDLSNDLGYITTHQDLSHLETKVNASLKLTEAKNYTDTKLSELIGTAPETLNTIHELATAFSSQGDLITALDTTLKTKADANSVYTKTEIDNKGYATQTWVSTEIEETIKDITGGEIDLTQYAKKSEIPTKTSQLTNDSGFLTEHQSLAGYAKETYVDQKVAALVGSAPETLNTLKELADALEGQDDVLTGLETTIATKANAADVYTKEEVDKAIEDITVGDLDLSDYATKAEVPTRITQLANDAGYVTSTVLSRYALSSDIPTNVSDLANDLGFITNGYLDNYAKKSDIPTIPINVSTFFNDSGYITTANLSGYATQTYVQNQIKSLIDEAPDALNTLREIATELQSQDSVITAIETTIGTKANASDVYTKTEIDNKLQNAGGKVTFRKWEVTV